ncbi:uncharacterized protein BDCG_06279 [Blastomyces dermatitidis ER-3]|uniref:MYND-type domain-containing protein n=1 Tax=Ajellomyces dermatitidis (strain ER-3 / ATCC MYA-2586) TaxID=559297 RepID=A0ABX2VXL2_AJEDR|nr:uncharacterized protein BDCG_06279 [Blastomyces dermatitidis ER-3]OAT01884.1 hypothetical protein BDCG_06279 [Blastomyces dermatitidis ER-3]
MLRLIFHCVYRFNNTTPDFHHARYTYHSPNHCHVMLELMLPPCRESIGLLPLNQFSLFHAIGNTPAVCLTQDIPGDDPARLLLLGCGDARNILFTSFMNSSSKPRPLDYTCCDIQPAVIARNVLLLTLVVDTNEGADTSMLWNIYYHLFIDDKSHNLLESQVKKLHRFSSSLKYWHKSEYGRFLRFCDSKTLALVRDIWHSYISVRDKADYLASFRKAIQACLDVKVATAGSGIDLGGARAAAPNAIQALKDLPGLHSRYWKNGSTSNDPKALNVHPNPTLAPLENDNALLHSGTDPLLGFHLVTAYTPVDAGSHFYRKEVAFAHAQNAVESARLQFNIWCQSLKRDHKSVTVRFFAGDALAFCHTLQHLDTTRETSAKWFRTSYGFDTVSLDGEDYALEDGVAPLAFDVIDTSNLIDFLGGINVFIAAGPLLYEKESSTIYAESFAKYVPEVDVLLNDLFAGHFPTVSILLGVFPVQYWTNSSAVANAEEQLMHDFRKCSMGDGVNTRNVYNRTLWKYQWPYWSHSPGSSCSSLIKFDPDSLAVVLFGIYMNMFMNEDVKFVLAHPSCEMIRYHRGSFVRFLAFVKGRVMVDWNKAISALITLIEADKALGVGQNFLHELYTQLHILDVYSDPLFTKEFKYDRSSHDFRAWKKMPYLVSITVKVPRAKLSVFTKTRCGKLAKPYINGFVQSKQMGLGQHSLFAVVQLGFGQAICSGPRNSDHFAVTIAKDHSGWKGKSPLIISFVVPSALLLAQPESTTVGMSLYHTPGISSMFEDALGTELVVFSSDLGNQSSVYISKHRPNHAGMPCPPQLWSNRVYPAKMHASSYHVTLTADIDKKKRIIDRFTARIDFLSKEAKAILTRQNKIVVSQPSPCSLRVPVEGQASEIVITFPAPVLKPNKKNTIRVARKSSYVEIIAHRAEKPDRQGYSDYMFPVFLSGGEPLAWNIPYLNPNRLPILDTNRMEDFGWLITHVSTMFSGKECEVRSNLDNTRPKPDQDSRLCFKDTLFAMHMSFARVKGEKCKVFGISCGDIGLHILFFRSSVRMDISNHTLALDVAIVPLRLDMEKPIRDFIAKLDMDELITMLVKEDELRLWKKLLPAFVERCREWKHKPTCEYKAKSRIPLSVELHQPVLCSCGNGIFPPNFVGDFPKWETVSKHAIRGLIPLLFTLPYLDTKDALGKEKKAGQNQCEACGAGKSVHGRALLSCSQCHLVRYCSSKCQRIHWKAHRKTCLGKGTGGPNC